MNDPLKVLHVWEPSTGGVDQHAQALALYQAETGLDVSVLCREQHVDLPGFAWQIDRSPAGLKRGISQLGSVVDRFTPDVVHLHSTVAGLVGRLSIRGRRPTIFTPHAWGFQIGGRMSIGLVGVERALARWTDLVIAVGETEARIGRERVGRLLIESVPNGIDLMRFRPPSVTSRETARTSYNLGAEPTAACIGRLTEQKGQDLLVDAWQHVRTRIPEARLLLAGDGPSISELVGRAADIGGITLLGDVDDVVSLMHAVDVVVQPSRWEGLSYSSIEALAVGLPIVATEIEPIVEVLGSFARYVPPGRIDALADAIVEQFGRAQRLGDPPVDRAQVAAAHDRFDVRAQHRTTTELTAQLASRLHDQR